MGKHTIEVWNQGGSGEFKTLSGMDNLEHGTELYTADYVAELASLLKSYMEAIGDAERSRCGINGDLCIALAKQECIEDKIEVTLANYKE